MLRTTIGATLGQRPPRRPRAGDPPRQTIAERRTEGRRPHARRRIPPAHRQGARRHGDRARLCPRRQQRPAAEELREDDHEGPRLPAARHDHREPRAPDRQVRRATPPRPLPPRPGAHPGPARDPAKRPSAPTSRGRATTRTPASRSSASSSPRARGPRSRYHFLTPGYTKATGTPLVAGADVGLEDQKDAPKVVLLNEAAARKYWTTPSSRRRRAPEPLGHGAHRQGRDRRRHRHALARPCRPRAVLPAGAALVPAADVPRSRRTDGDPTKARRPHPPRAAGNRPGAPARERQAAGNASPPAPSRRAG